MWEYADKNPSLFIVVTGRVSSSTDAKITISSSDHDLDDESPTTGWETCTTAARKVFNKKLLFKRIPILSWLPSYNGEQAVSDLIAGLTVGLTIIPQGIAYAIVAQLPPQVNFFLIVHSTYILATNSIFL